MHHDTIGSVVTPSKKVADVGLFFPEHAIMANAGSAGLYTIQLTWEAESDWIGKTRNGSHCNEKCWTNWHFDPMTKSKSANLFSLAFYVQALSKVQKPLKSKRKSLFQ